MKCLYETKRLIHFQGSKTDADTPPMFEKQTKQKKQKNKKQKNKKTKLVKEKKIEIRARCNSF